MHAHHIQLTSCINDAQALLHSQESMIKYTLLLSLNHLRGHQVAVAAINYSCLSSFPGHGLATDVLHFLGLLSYCTWPTEVNSQAILTLVAL